MKALAEEVRKQLDNVKIDELPDLVTIYNLSKI